MKKEVNIIRKEVLLGYITFIISFPKYFLH